MNSPVMQTAIQILAEMVNPQFVPDGNGYFTASQIGKLNRKEVAMYPGNPLSEVHNISLLFLGGEYESTELPYCVGLVIPDEYVLFPDSHGSIIECPVDQFVGFYHDMQKAIIVAVDWQKNATYKETLARFNEVWDDENTVIVDPKKDFSSYLRPHRYCLL